MPNPCHGVSGWELVDYEWTPPARWRGGARGSATITYERVRRDGTVEEVTVTREE